MSDQVIPAIPQPTPADFHDVALILQGLLASGHFTCMIESETGSDANYVRFDRGDDWKKDGAPIRCPSVAVLETINLWFELAEELSYAIRSKAEDSQVADAARP